MHLGYDDPWSDHSDHVYGPPAERGRLCHLVFVDGNLVDTWTEPVEHTRYEELARRLRPEPRVIVEPPRTPEWKRRLDWLDELVGGRPNLLALDDAPLADAMPLGVPAEIVAVTDRLTKSRFVDEVAQGCRNALGLLWRLNPVLARALEPEEQAVAAAWLVGRANGVVGNGGITQKALAEAVGLTKAPTAAINRLRAEIQGICSVTRHAAEPDVLALRHPQLLTSRTRAELIRLRDEAMKEAALQAAQPVLAGG